jgi:transmembrane sensor
VEPPKAGLTRAGKAIRAALEEYGPEAAEQLRVARDGLLERVASGDGRSRRIGWPAAIRVRGRVLAGVAAMAVVLTGATLAWVRRPISFQVGGTDTSGKLGDVVESTGRDPATMEFSEGSSIVLGADARVRVLAAEANGARVLVENGGMDVSIMHRRRASTRWRFEAGPFHVAVTGTKFHLAFNPKDRGLSVDTTEGAVVVSGACLDGPRTVSAGDRLRVACPATAPPDPSAPTAAPARATMAPAATAPAASTTVAANGPQRGPATDLEGRLEPADNVPPGALVPAPRASGRDRWRPLLAAGQLAEGLRAAEDSDFSRVLRVANQKELAALGDAARLSGHVAHATEALLSLRQRHPGTPEAATAAFTLGRIAFERRRAYDEAARWFAAYLSEAPRGPLMGDAVGRLMEARRRAGDRAGARSDAERYLRRFPEGPYAPEARVVLAD